MSTRWDPTSFDRVTPPVLVSWGGCRVQRGCRRRLEDVPEGIRPEYPQLQSPLQHWSLWEEGAQTERWW